MPLVQLRGGPLAGTYVEIASTETLRTFVASAHPSTFLVEHRGEGGEVVVSVKHPSTRVEIAIYRREDETTFVYLGRSLRGREDLPPLADGIPA
jgi:hypothetical protein